MPTAEEIERLKKLAGESPEGAALIPVFDAKGYLLRSKIGVDNEASASASPQKTNKTIVSKEELDKSGLSLRDYLNKQRGLTRRAEPKSPLSTDVATMAQVSSSQDSAFKSNEANETNDNYDKYRDLPMNRSIRLLKQSFGYADGGVVINISDGLARASGSMVPNERTYNGGPGVRSRQDFKKS